MGQGTDEATECLEIGKGQAGIRGRARNISCHEFVGIKPRKQAVRKFRTAVGVSALVLVVA